MKRYYIVITDDLDITHKFSSFTEAKHYLEKEEKQNNPGMIIFFTPDSSKIFGYRFETVYYGNLFKKKYR